MPILARKILGDDGDGSFLIGVCPRQIAAGNERRAQGREESGGDEFEAAYWRQFALARTRDPGQTATSFELRPSMGTAVEKPRKKRPELRRALLRMSCSMRTTRSGSESGIWVSGM